MSKKVVIYSTTEDDSVVDGKIVKTPSLETKLAIFKFLDGIILIAFLVLAVKMMRNGFYPFLALPVLFLRVFYYAQYQKVVRVLNPDQCHRKS